MAGVVRQFALRYSWAIRWLLSPMGLGPAHASCDIYHGFVRVRMGWAFHSDIPRTSITAARIYPGVIRWTAGAHTDFRGRWLVNGAGSGIIELTIDPPCEGWTSGFPIHLRCLLIGLEDPEGFLGALAGGAPSGSAAPAESGDGSGEVAAL